MIQKIGRNDTVQNSQQKNENRKQNLTRAA